MSNATNSLNETTHSLTRTSNLGTERVSVTLRADGRYEMCTELFPSRRREAPSVRVGWGDREAAKAFWLGAKKGGFN